MNKKKSRKAASATHSVSPVQTREKTTKSAFDPSSWWQSDWAFGLLLAVATLFAYYPAWNGLPIWDDEYHITRRSLQSLAGLYKIWTHPGATPQYYPIVHTVFWIEHQLWGDATLGYHLVNILLHIVSALILLRILRRLEVPGAPIAVTLFALHPVQVESVAWISELKNALSGVFFFSAAAFYLHFRFQPRRRWAVYAIAFLLFLLALLSKSVVAVLPAVLLVVLWWKKGRLTLKEDVLPLIPFFAFGVGSGLLTAWMERANVGAIGPEFQFSWMDRFLIAGRAIWFYLGKLAWPQTLIFNYPHWNVHADVWWQYLFPAAALMASIGLWRIRNWSRAPLAAFLLFGGTLFPALGFLNVYPFRYAFVADHFQYLACIAPLALAAAGITAALERMKESSARMARPLVVLSLMIVLGVMTWQQSGMYVDIETVWQTTIDRNPGSWMAIANLGETLLQKNQVEAGTALLEKAIQLKPDYADPYNNLGTVLQQKGQLDSAETYYEKALALKPDHPDANFNLGVILLQKGRMDEAVSHLKKVVEIRPADAESHRELGFALQQKRQLPEAIVQYQTALGLQPDSADYHNDLGSAFLANGQSSDAIQQFEKVLTMHSDDVLALNNLAWVLATAEQPSLRDGARAVTLSLQANQLTGNANPTILRTLSTAYAAAGRLDEAMAADQMALRLAEATPDPVFADTLRKEILRYLSLKHPH